MIKYEWIRAGKSKSLIRWKRLKGGKRQKKGGKGEFDLQLDLISGDVLNPESEGSPRVTIIVSKKS